MRRAAISAAGLACGGAVSPGQPARIHEGGFVADGHCPGPPSDKHLQHCSREAGRKTLVTPDALPRDLDADVRKKR